MLRDNGNGYENDITFNKGNNANNITNSSLSDPHKAATKIQSTFRGFKTRKEIEQQQQKQKQAMLSSAQKLTQKRKNLWFDCYL